MIAVVTGVIIIVGAIYAFNNSIGSDTSGDDTRPVVNNVLPATDMNVQATTAPAVRSRGTFRGHSLRIGDVLALSF